MKSPNPFKELFCTEDVLDSEKAPAGPVHIANEQYTMIARLNPGGNKQEGGKKNAF